MMDWLTDLLKREEHLKKKILEISKFDELEANLFDTKEYFHKIIKPKIEEIQAAIDDYLCGRNEAERSWMNYEVSINLPVFSHLRNIYSLHSPVRV